MQSAAALADAREVLSSGNQRDNSKENKENIDVEKETGTCKSQTKIMVRCS